MTFRLQHFQNRLPRACWIFEKPMVFSHLGVGVLREPGLYIANTNMNSRFCSSPGVHVNNPLQKNTTKWIAARLLRALVEIFANT